MSLARAMARRPLAVLAFATATVTAVALGTGTAAQAAPARTASTATGLYIVQMVGDPLASYQGNVKGYAATKPTAGHKLAAHSTTSKAYASLLRSRQDAALAKAGVTAKSVVYHYGTTFNGVAVHLTADQLLRLQKGGSVVNVWKNRIQTTDAADAQVPRASTATAGRVEPAVRQRQATPARASSSATSTPASGRRARASRR